MEPLARRAAIAAIATVFVAIFGLFVDFPKLKIPGVDSEIKASTPAQEGSSPLRPESKAIPDSSRDGSSSQAPTSSRAQAHLAGTPLPRGNPDIEVQAASVEPRRSPREVSTPALPVEFALEDGEQKVLFSGEAAVAIEFIRVGEMELATLRIHTDGSTRNHALLSPGGRYEFAAGGESYLLSILRLDTAQGRAVLRIDSKRP